MDKALVAVTGVMFAMVMLTVVVGMVQATTPQPQYQCPICGEPFVTYDELYSHFVAEHPAEPLDIIWD